MIIIKLNKADEFLKNNNNKYKKIISMLISHHDYH